MDKTDSPTADPKGVSISDSSYFRRFIICRANELSAIHSVSTLRHPRFDSGVLFIVDTEHHVLYEVTSIVDQRRSLFYGDSVIQNTSMQMLVKFDPIFIALPYLQKYASEKYVSLDECLVDEQFPAISLICNKSLMNGLKTVVNFKELDDDIYFKYDEEKALCWLEKRFTVLKATVLKFELVSQRLRSDESSLDRYVFGIFSDFITLQHSVLVKSRLKIKSGELNAFENQAPSKRSLASSEIAPSEKKTRTNAAKKLTQASKGTKSLLSFFSPRSMNNQEE